jgi:hypothetical protein
MLKAKIISTTLKEILRIFKIETYANIAHLAKQYSSGGDDYCPSDNTECLTANVNNNEAETVIYCYNDKTTKICQAGEKRIFATDTEGNNIKAEIHLKNNGDISITTNGILTINGNVNQNGNTNQNGNVSINGTLEAESLIDNSGASGTFVDTGQGASGKTLTIEKGIIKSIS